MYAWTSFGNKSDLESDQKSENMPDGSSFQLFPQDRFNMTL